MSCHETISLKNTVYSMFTNKENPKDLWCFTFICQVYYIGYYIYIYMYI